MTVVSITWTETATYRQDFPNAPEDLDLHDPVAVSAFLAEHADFASALDSVDARRIVRATRIDPAS